MVDRKTMTVEELIVWGRAENAQRQSEVAEIRDEAALKVIQKACATRRKAVGLSRGEALAAMLAARRFDSGIPLGLCWR